MKKIKNLVFPLLLFAFITNCSIDDPVIQEEFQIEKTVSDSTDYLSYYTTAVFAAGCFWCTEAIFESLKGVEEVITCYSGGITNNPTYQQANRGSTGHAQSVIIYYDSAKVSYPTLLKVYFASHEDPTQADGHGPDLGSQYRSVIFYKSLTEKQFADNLLEDLNNSIFYYKPIAIEVVPFDRFWKAEDHHQDYILKNPDNSYIKDVSIPRLRYTQEKVPELIKPDKLIIEL